MVPVEDPDTLGTQGVRSCGGCTPLPGSSGGPGWVVPKMDTAITSAARATTLRVGADDSWRPPRSIATSTSAEWRTGHVGPTAALWLTMAASAFGHEVVACANAMTCSCKTTKTDVLQEPVVSDLQLMSRDLQG